MDYVSPELEAYPANQRDPNGLWCNGRMVLTIYGYNTRKIPNGGSMTSWAEFVDPDFSDGRIGISNPLESGGALQNYINIRNHPDLGRKFWEELAALRPTIVSGPSPLTKMNISGQTPLAVNNGYNLYEERKKGAPIAPVYPKELVTTGLIPMAIAKEAPNPEGAKIVYDWWLSKEGQTVLRDVNSIYSGRADVDPLPGLPKYGDLNIVVTPLEEIEARRDEMQNEFKQLFNV
jgi:iron(III) transport system substrate-binding protein